MLTDELLLTKAKKLIESKLNWGDSGDWTNQDFIALSEKIQEQLNIPLSHVTLKRIWGKVKYESLPNTHTLNTLVQFIGYESWREFKIKHSDTNSTEVTTQEVTPKKTAGLSVSKKFFRLVDVASTAALLAGCIAIFVQAKKWQLNPDD